MLGIEIRDGDFDDLEVMFSQPDPGPMQAEGETAKPEQRQRGDRGHDRFPDAPTISRSSKDEKEEEEEGIALGSRKQRNQRRPHDIAAVHQQAERRGGLLMPPQQQYDGGPLGNINGQQD